MWGNGTPQGIVPEPEGGGGERPSCLAIIGAFAVPAGGAMLMQALSRMFGFTTALLIMAGIVILTVAVMVPILLRRNRRTRSEPEDKATG